MHLNMDLDPEEVDSEILELCDLAIAKLEKRNADHAAQAQHATTWATRWTYVAVAAFLVSVVFFVLSVT